MSQQSNKKDVWLRLTNSKVLKQELQQELQTGRNSDAAGNPLAKGPQTSDLMQTSSQSLPKARGASHTRKAKLEAPTKRPAPSQASGPADATQPSKAYQAPITGFHDSSRRSEGSRKPQHELDSPSAEEHDDNDDKDTDSLLYLYENLYKLRELGALPEIEHNDE